MEHGSTRGESTPDKTFPPVSVREVTGRILEFADSTVPRAQFLKELARMMIDFTDCDVVRLVLKDQGRSYRCELRRDRTRPFRFDVLVGIPGEGSRITWSSGNNEALESQCRNILSKRTDPKLPWFTRHGSLWTGDIDSLSVDGLRRTDSGSDIGISIDNDCASLALIPIETHQDRVGLLQLVSTRKHHFGKREVEVYEQLSQTLGVAMAHRRLQLALRERVKELTCLCGIARLAAQPDMPLEVLLRKAVELLPPGWLHPESACARVLLDGRTFATGNYRKAVQSMTADLVINGKRRGLVEVGYLWEKPVLDEGPFLSEERNLIDTIAHELSIIVEQKQTQNERSRLEEQLLHADRLATIGQLGAGLAHELNEPLANILGFAQLVAKDETLTDQTKQDIGKIVTATLHAREVISKLLVFARQTTQQKSRVDLSVLVEDGLHFLQSRCGKAGIELIRNLSKNLPEITADRAQLLQVLTNLVVNAIQAMPRGGRLVLTTGGDEKYVRLTVEDTGVGMSEDVMKDIFNPFFTTKDVDEGTGLGLSVVHGIVTAHGGTIGVESTEGLGTKFTIRLPIETPANE